MRTERADLVRVLVARSLALVACATAAALVGTPQAMTDAAPLPGAGTPPARPPPVGTVSSLMAAHEADVHASARYGAFAEQADREGYPYVAALFRAAAQAEGVRARNHGEALRRLGVEPTPRPSRPRVMTTRANLYATLGHENAEHVDTYPRYVQQARRDGVPEAILSFTLGHHSETDLVRLYQDALEHLDPARPPEEFHVCSTCGHVIRGRPPEMCPVSLSPREAFVRVR